MVEWLKNSVFYQIYPQSFKDTNSDGIGDLKGITEKLDYVKNMGFTAIWINPCFKSPFFDAGYDVEDFYSVAPRYGTNDDMKNLFEEAHKRGLHIILDLVAGHTSIECKWFKESMKPEKNKYSGRYIWSDYVHHDMKGIHNINGAIKGYSTRNGAFAVNYYFCQPALNYGFWDLTEPWQMSIDSPDAISTREEILNIMRFWLKMGCDGFRVDMANSLVKNDREHLGTIKIWQEMLGIIRKEFPNAAFLSEWGEPDLSLEAGFDMDFLLPVGSSHYIDLFHSETPFFSHNACGTIREFLAKYMENRDKVKNSGKEGIISLSSDCHDTKRFSRKLDEAEIKLAFAFIMSMPSVPYVYYGDEIGMKYLEDIKSVEGGYERTGSRSPMQWNDEANAGFSNAAPDDLYIMQDPDRNRPTVEKQIADEASILNELKRQISIRKSNPELQELSEITIVSDTYPLCYLRGSKEDGILVIINPSDAEYEIEIGFNIKNYDVIYEFNAPVVVQKNKIKISGCSASYIQIIPNDQINSENEKLGE